MALRLAGGHDDSSLKLLLPALGQPGVTAPAGQPLVGDLDNRIVVFGADGLLHRIY